MAKKMKLDSLLTANKKNKGIEKMSEYSNQDKEEKKPSSQDLLAQKQIFVVLHFTMNRDN